MISTSSLRTNAELWTTRDHGRWARNRGGRRLTPAPRRCRRRARRTVARSRSSRSAVLGAVALDDAHERLVVVHGVIADLDGAGAGALQRVAHRPRTSPTSRRRPPATRSDRPPRVAAMTPSTSRSTSRSGTGRSSSTSRTSPPYAARSRLAGVSSMTSSPSDSTPTRSHSAASPTYCVVTSRVRPALAQLVELVPELGPQDRVDAGGRLVEEHERRIVHEARRRGPGAAACRPRPRGPACRGRRVSSTQSSSWRRRRLRRSRRPYIEAWKLRFSHSDSSGNSAGICGR